MKITGDIVETSYPVFGELKYRDAFKLSSESDEVYIKCKIGLDPSEDGMFSLRDSWATRMRPGRVVIKLNATLVLEAEVDDSQAPPVPPPA